MKRKQVVLNIIANLISVLVSMLISFFLTPYIVRNIGKEAFSFVPISSNFTSYMTVLTISLTSMTSRFVTLKIHKNDMESANEFYSTSFYANLALSGIISILFVIIYFFLDKIINIPSGILTDVKMLFAIMFVSFIINLSTTSFSVAAFCMNRLDVSSTISIIGSFARVFVIFLTFTFLQPKIYYIGLSILVVTIIQGLSNLLISKRIIPKLKISFNKVKIKALNELFSSGIWNSFNALSYILLTGLDLVIANIMLGSSAAGTLAVAKTAPMALQTLITVVPTTFSPYLTILYAKEDSKAFLSELMYILKFTSIIIGIPIAGFIALNSAFFKLWVPSVASSEMSILALLTMISMVASFSIMPLTFIFTITNRLKWPSIFIFLTGILNVSIELLLISKTNLGLYAIAGTSSVLEIFRCLVFVPIYSAQCLNLKRTIFFNFIKRSLIYMVTIISIFSLIASIFPIHSWIQMILNASIMSIIGILVGTSITLNDEEKKKTKIILKNLARKS